MSFTLVPITVSSNTLICVQLKINTCPTAFQAVCLITLVCNLVQLPTDNSSHLATAHALPVRAVSASANASKLPNPLEYLFFFFPKEVEIILDCTAQYLFCLCKIQPQTQSVCFP